MTNLFPLDRKEITYRLTWRNETFLIDLKWPTPSAFRAVWESMIVPSKIVSANEVVTPLGSINPHFVTFMAEHAIRLRTIAGVLAEGDALIDWLRKNNPRTLFAEATLNQLLSINVLDPINERITTLADLDTNRPISFTVSEFDNEEQTEVNYAIDVELTPATALDRQEWNDARYIVNHKNERWMQAKAIPIANLFTRRIASISGVSFGDIPLDLQSKNTIDAIALIPFPWMFGVLSHDSRGAEAKSFT